VSPVLDHVASAQVLEKSSVFDITRLGQTQLGVTGMSLDKTYRYTAAPALHIFVACMHDDIVAVLLSLFARHHKPFQAAFYHLPLSGPCFPSSDPLCPRGTMQKHSVLTPAAVPLHSATTPTHPQTPASCSGWRTSGRGPCWASWHALQHSRV
jgi:hypothetical protein